MIETRGWRSSADGFVFSPAKNRHYERRARESGVREEPRIWPRACIIFWTVRYTAGISISLDFYNPRLSSDAWVPKTRASGTGFHYIRGAHFSDLRVADRTRGKRLSRLIARYLANAPGRFDSPLPPFLTRASRRFSPEPPLVRPSSLPLAMLSRAYNPRVAPRPRTSSLCRIMPLSLATPSLPSRDTAVPRDGESASMCDDSGGFSPSPPPPAPRSCRSFPEPYRKIREAKRTRASAAERCRIGKRPVKMAHSRVATGREASSDFFGGRDDH